MSGAAEITLEIAEQAMSWYLELAQPQVSAETLLACQRWRQANPLHEQAWLRAENLGRRMSDMRQHRPLASAALSAGGSRRRVIKQLALLLVVGAGAWRARESGLVPPLLADYRSAVGERRNLELAGGLRLQLNTDSAIDVQARRIELLRGEILVTLERVAQSQRLRVETREGAVTSAQGQFSVRQRDGYSQVALLSGEARIEPRSGAPRGLRVDERVNFTRQEIFARRATGAELAWTQGMIVADSQPLGDFLAELARYRHGHLGCDPALVGLRVSGTYPLDDTDRVLSAISRTLDLQLRSVTRYWVTLQPRAVNS